MKRILSFLCAMAAPFAVAATATVGGKTWSYEVYDASYGGLQQQAARITGGPETGALDVPEMLAGYPVLSIGEGAFEGCSKLTALTLPDSVLEIQDAAFEGCAGLKTLTLPLVIPPAVAGESTGAPFFGCVNVQKVTFTGISAPGGIESLGQIFPIFADGSVRPKEVTFTKEAFTAGLDLRTPEISGGIIWGSAFCERIETLTIEINQAHAGFAAAPLPMMHIAIELPHLKTLKFAFEGTPAVSQNPPVFSVSVSNSPNLTALTGLETCDLPLGLMLENLNSLKTLKVTKNLSSVICQRCDGLTAVTFADKPITLARGSLLSLDFLQCTALKTLDLSHWDSVPEITGYWNLRGCTALTSVTLPNFRSADAMPLSARLRGCTSLKSVELPSMMNSLEDETFRGCTSLTEVTIPDSVTRIGRDVFRGCTALKKIKFMGLPPMMDPDMRFPVGAMGEFYVTFVERWNQAIDAWNAVAGSSGSRWYGLEMMMDGNVTLAIEIDPEGAGKATGAGEYKSNTKVNLKATPNKDYIFIGWHDETGEPLGDRVETFDPASDTPDFRSPAFPYVTGTRNVKLCAAFIAKEEASLSDPISLSYMGYDASGNCIYDSYLSSDENPQDTVVEIAPEQDVFGRFLADSWALPVMKVTGLPAGLKFDAKRFTLSGRAKTPGRYTVRVTATAEAEAPAAGAFVLSVANYNSSEIDILETYGDQIRGEGETGFVPGKPCNFPIPEAEGCKVSGLPPGMKWDAKTLTLTGTPTKPGDYTVTFTKGKEIETVVITIQPFPTLTVALYDFDGGTATGGGDYPAGKKVTLKATADKGYVFAGWYTEYGDPLGYTYEEGTGFYFHDPEMPDYRTASFAYITTDRDTTVYARFVPEDYLPETPQTYLLQTYTDAIGNWKEILPQDHYFPEMVTPVEIEAGREMMAIIETDILVLPTITVKGLPAGLKFNSKNFMITGTPKTPGIYTVTVETRAAGVIDGTAVGKFAIQVGNYNSSEIDILETYGDLITGDANGEFVPGKPCDLPIPGAEDCKVSGLPPGMKWDAKTLALTGTPTKPGDYTVTFTKGKEVETVVIRIRPFPELTLGWFDSYGYPTDDGEEMGALSGGGAYPANKKVTLKATVKPGYVFAGWFYEYGMAVNEFERMHGVSVPDYRTPAYDYITTAESTRLFAKFLPATELDNATMSINFNGAGMTYEAGVPINPIYVHVAWPTLPTVTVTGLPAGLTFDPKTLFVSGTPKDPGDYSVTITATDKLTGTTCTETFPLSVEHFNAHGIHDYGRQDLYLVALTAEDFPLENLFGGKLRGVRVKSLKLPAGLTLATVDGRQVLRGTGALKCGSYTVTLTDTDGAVSTFTLIVDTHERFTVISDPGMFQPNPTTGFVQGEAADMDILEVYPYEDNEAYLKHLSVEITGLPAGLKGGSVADGKEVWDGWNSYERPCLYAEVSGKTTVQAKSYPVKVTVTDSRTGYTETHDVTVYVYPPLTAAKGDGNWIVNDFRQTIPIGYGPWDAYYWESSSGSVDVDFICSLKGTSRTCTYDAVFTDSYGATFPKKQTMRLDEVTAASDGSGAIIYDYYFEGLDTDDEYIGADLLITDYGNDSDPSTRAEFSFEYHSVVDKSKELNARVEAYDIPIDRDERFWIKEEGAHDTDQVVGFTDSGFVQGEPAVLEVGEIIPYPGTKLAGFKVTATGLPRGITVKTERDDYDDDAVTDVEGVLEIYLTGKTSADPGIYHAEITISESGTGFTETLEYDYLVLPPIPKEWYGTYRASRDDFQIGEIGAWGEYNPVPEWRGTASATLTVTLGERLKRATFESDCSYRSGWEYNGNPPLDRVAAFRSEDGKIGWCYSFWHETIAGDEAYGDLIFWVDANAQGEPDMDSGVRMEMCCGLYISETSLYIWEGDNEYCAPFKSEVVRE